MHRIKENILYKKAAIFSSCRRCNLTLAVFVVALLVLYSLHLSNALESEINTGQNLKHLNDELTEELLLINYSLGSTFNPGQAMYYIEYNSPEIKKLAFELDTPERMYYFVLKNISYVQLLKSSYATDALNLKKGDCYAKSNLLASLLRARGYPSERVKVVAGAVYTNKEKTSATTHGWVEFFDSNKKTWFALDTTTIADIAYFEKYEKRDYYKNFVRETFFEYNDGYYSVLPPLREEEVIAEAAENTQPQ